MERLNKYYNMRKYFEIGIFSILRQRLDLGLLVPLLPSCYCFDVSVLLFGLGLA